MTAHILYRSSTNPAVPGGTSAKGSSLSMEEVDGNFKSIVNELGTKAPIASPEFTGQPKGAFSQTAEIDVASASSVDIGAQSSKLLRITGTTTILSFGASYNGPVFIRFADVLTLTHNATSLVIPGGNNLTTAAGDSCIMIPKTSISGTFDGWRVSNFIRGAETPGVSGAVITDDTTTNASRYILFDDVTSGNATSVGVSSTKLYFNPSTGTLNSTAFNALSDATLKKHVSNIKGATKIVNQLAGVEFVWKDTGLKSAGVIAQELEAVLPHLVATSKETGIKSVNYSGLMGYLINAVKELTDRVSALENR